MERPNFKVDVRGVYAHTGGTVNVHTFHDLINNNIFVSPEAVKETWGAEVAQEYTTERAKAQRKA